MNIDVYQSASDSSKFLSVPAGADLKKIPISEEKSKVYGDVKLFKKNISVNAGDKKIALNADEVISQIQTNGYAFHGAKIEIKSIE